MTKEEREVRDVLIAKVYLQGNLTYRQIGEAFGLKRQRVQQIIKELGVVRPRDPKKDDFLGVHVDEATKERLRIEAERRGVSMSALTVDMITDMLRDLPETT